VLVRHELDHQGRLCWASSLPVSSRSRSTRSATPAIAGSKPGSESRRPGRACGSSDDSGCGSEAENGCGSVLLLMHGRAALEEAALSLPPTPTESRTPSGSANTLFNPGITFVAGAKPEGVAKPLAWSYARTVCDPVELNPHGRPDRQSSERHAGSAGLTLSARRPARLVNRRSPLNDRRSTGRPSFRTAARRCRSRVILKTVGQFQLAQHDVHRTPSDSDTLVEARLCPISTSTGGRGEAAS
jgi:hypothetical protein